MIDFFLWFTDLGNSKTVAAVLFFTVFVVIVCYVFTGKARKLRYDHYRYIPLLDVEPQFWDDENNASVKEKLQ